MTDHAPAAPTFEGPGLFRNMTDRETLDELIRQDDARVAMKSKTLEEFSVAWVAKLTPTQGGEYYRALRPAALASRRFDWHTVFANEVGGEVGVENGPLLARSPNGHIMKPKVLIVRPIKEWTQQQTEQAHANGQKVIADLDDDIWRHEDWTPETRAAASADHFDEWFPNVDAVLVSTHHLKAMIIADGHSAPVFVAPNCYDPHGLRCEPLPGRNIGTRLWLSGRMNADLGLYRSLFMPLLEELDLTFVHLGKHEQSGKPGEGTHGIDSFTKLGAPLDRLIELPSCTIPEFPEKLGRFLSIGAIAMAEVPYNMAKTETHAIELASMGIPLAAATTLKIYDEVPGVVEPTPEAVGARVEALLKRDYWFAESDRARTWARAVATTNEELYLAALAEAVAGLYA